jgi:predicted dehydrogenase
MSGSSSAGAAIRVGLVGAGFMAKAHSLAYANAPLLGPGVPPVERARVADINAELARRAASAYGWSEASADWRAVTRADDIDLVDVAVPNDKHAEIAIDAARHGKHVLCEKPLANTLAAAREMHRAVDAAGVEHFVAFVYRTWPAMTLARRLIDEGALGRLIRLRALYFHDYGLDETLSLTWRLRRSSAGAGSIVDIGSHVIDLARLLAGEIRRVMARSVTVVPERPDTTGRMAAVDVDDLSDVLVEFADGATGLIETSWVAAGSKTDLAFEAVGDGGAVRFTWRRPMELLFYSHDDPPERRGFRAIVIGPQHEGAGPFWPVAGQGLGWGDAFTILLQRVLKSIAGQKERGTATFLDGLRAAEVVDAAMCSATEGRWVDVSIDGRTGHPDPAASRPWDA